MARPYRVTASVATIRGRIGRWAEARELDAEHCRVAITADSLDWAALALGTIHADLRVLDPPELIDHLADWARRFSRAGGGDPARRGHRLSGTTANAARSALPAKTRYPMCRPETLAGSRMVTVVRGSGRRCSAP